MKTNLKKDDRIIWEIYQKLFLASTPSANFDELVENATINEFGQKEIPFMDYEIDEEQCISIIQDTLKEYKIPKWRRPVFERTIYLGCSPKFIKK